MEAKNGHNTERLPIESLYTRSKKGRGLGGRVWRGLFLASEKSGVCGQWKRKGSVGIVTWSSAVAFILHDLCESEGAARVGGGVKQNINKYETAYMVHTGMKRLACSEKTIGANSKVAPIRAMRQDEIYCVYKSPSIHIMLKPLFCCAAESHCSQQCFHHLDTGHRCRKDICMKAAQTNMEESEHDAERGNYKQEKDQNEELVPNRGANSVVQTWCGWKVKHGPENHTFKIWK